MTGPSELDKTKIQISWFCVFGNTYRKIKVARHLLLVIFLLSSKQEWYLEIKNSGWSNNKCSTNLCLI